MAIYKSESLIGWESNNGEFFCSECFEKEHADDNAGWAPVQENEDYVYICDICKQRV